MALVTFKDTLHYLYENLPMFQRIGAAALKPDLGNTLALCGSLGNPQEKFKSIHVAGTNGKGSVSHMLASVLQSAGYKTGLYTSPHLKTFTERIRINGKEVEEQFVVDFVNRTLNLTEAIRPSFFELTVAMAFDYFAISGVDFAIIETGLGGRLDSTNVIHPILSIITNIGMDHKGLLGDTLQKIASEKAGIIKPSTPVVVSERQPETEAVMVQKARFEKAPIVFASDQYAVRFTDNGSDIEVSKDGVLILEHLRLPLGGHYQARNVAGVMAALELLNNQGMEITPLAIMEGLERTVSQTGLKGRWQIINYKPLIICDTGHNVEAVQETMRQLNLIKCAQRIIVWGMVRDKDIDAVLKILPPSAFYFFCAPALPRALPAADLMHAATCFGLRGECYESVPAAVKAATKRAMLDDVIFIGGSTFVVAEVEGI